MAVAVDDATPEPLVTADGTEADAPEPGGANVTVAPGTRLLKLSRTSAVSAVANAVWTTVDCALPPVRAIDAGAPGVLVSENEVGSKPSAVAETEYEPVLVPAVTLVCTRPELSVSALVVPTRQMAQLLHDEPAFSTRFIEYMLSRNIRIEEDLVDQLFNSSEKRLARTLMLLARYGMPDTPQAVLPKLSQEMLAEMVGTTRSRVNFFMNKFRKLGFIEYNGGLKINAALLSVVLHE